MTLASVYRSLRSSYRRGNSHPSPCQMKKISIRQERRGWQEDGRERGKRRRQTLVHSAYQAREALGRQEARRGWTLLNVASEQSRVLFEFARRQ